MESIFGANFDRRHQIKAGSKAKEAKDLMKKGKKLAKSDPKKAISCYSKARSIYKSLLALGRKMPNETVNADSTISGTMAGKDGTYGSISGHTAGKTIDRNTGHKNNVINWCQSKILACENAIDKIKGNV